MHFTGIAGSGMSALSQMSFWEGNVISGSDRDFDRGQNSALKKKFEKMGIRIYPQTGEGIGEQTDEVVVSTAVEETNPDIQKAKKLNIPIVHRSDFLSSYVSRFRTIAVAGTSGKSTVAAMIFEILSSNGFSPSIINGAELLSLREKGLIGNAFRGRGSILVIEADESDGSIVKYRPEIGVVLNISRDHKDVEELEKIFAEFSRNCRKFFINSEGVNSSDFDCKTIKFPEKEFVCGEVSLKDFSAKFEINKVKFSLSLPGYYNVQNALAAARICTELGLSLEKISRSFEKYKGLFRRFNIIGTANDITVIDDYAHNPAKIKAVLESLWAAQKGKIIAVYQPHGYAPARSLRRDLVNSFVFLKGNGLLIMPEIFYAGGTVVRDISSKDLIEDAVKMGIKGFFLPFRKDIINLCALRAKKGDIVIVMGARDNSLSDFAREIFERISGKVHASEGKTGAPRAKQKSS